MRTIDQFTDRIGYSPTASGPPGLDPATSAPVPGHGNRLRHIAAGFAWTAIRRCARSVISSSCGPGRTGPEVEGHATQILYFDLHIPRRCDGGGGCCRAGEDHRTTM